MLMEDERINLAGIEESLRFLPNQMQEILNVLFGTTRARVFDDEGMSLRLMWIHEQAKKIEAALGRIEIAVTGILIAVVAHVWHHW
jgi:hypothetical protein